MREVIFELKEVYFKYPDTDRRVLDGVGLRLYKGEILSILGPNGAGKSTLLNCMAKLLKPDSGEIFICGINIRNMSHRDVARKISYVQQMHTPAFAYTVMDFVLLGRAPKIGFFRKPGAEDERIAFQALEMLNISHLANKPYTDISGGERQQATIARAVVQEPEAILFDEPTAHLDYGNQYKTLKMIRAMSGRGYTVVFTTHNPDHAIMLGGKAAIIDRDGHLEYGDSVSIITEERLKEVYKTELRLLEIKELSRTACLPPGL